MEEEVFVSRPPTNVKEKRTARELVRKTVRKKKFITVIKSAFLETANGKESITLEQWMTSPIREIISEVETSNEQYVQFFQKIDANNDGKITWNDLSLFLILDTNVQTRQTKDASKFIQKMSMPPTVSCNAHRDIIALVIFSKWTQEYLTLSRDALKFWCVEPFNYKRSLKCTVPICAVCTFSTTAILAICLSNRKLQFYNINTLEQLPIEVSASPTDSRIKNWKMEETEKAFRSLRTEEVPLYNIPTFLIEAELQPKADCSHTVIISDDNGFIEMFTLETPKHRNGRDYSINRTLHKKIHSDAIVEMKVIKDIEVYSTCSLDGTVKFWTISPTDNSLSIIRNFTEASPVSTFTYMPSQNFIAIFPKHTDPYIWNTQPPKHAFKITQQYSYPVASTLFKTPGGELTLVTLSVRGELRFFHELSFALCSEVSENFDNQINSILYDEQHGYLVACSRYPMLWTTGSVNEQMKQVSHQHDIVGTFLSRNFDRIVSIDSAGIICIWNYYTGAMEETRSLEVENIGYATIDISGRRLITASFDSYIDIWNFSSGGHITRVSLHDGSSTCCISSFNIGLRSYFAVGTTSRKVVVFMESSPGTFDTYKTFSGHKYQISSIAVDYINGCLISSSIGGEIFVWPIQCDMTPRNIKSLAPIESLAVSGSILYSVDSNGLLTLFSLPLLNIELSCDPHRLRVPYSLSAIAAHSGSERIATADTFGYVRTWKKFEPNRIVRCHFGEVLGMEFVKNGNYLVTYGIDYAIRLWNSDSLELVGCFKNDSMWSLYERESWSLNIIPPDSRITIDLNKPEELATIREKTCRSTKHFDLLSEIRSSRISKLELDIDSKAGLNKKEIFKNDEEKEKHFSTANWHDAIDLMNLYFNGAYDNDLAQSPTRLLEAEISKPSNRMRHSSLDRSIDQTENLLRTIRGMNKEIDIKKPFLEERLKKTRHSQETFPSLPQPKIEPRRLRKKSGQFRISDIDILPRSGPRVPPGII